MTQLDKIIQARRRDDELYKQHQERLHQERLLLILRKKLSRIFIGDIQLIEHYLGELWGHGKPAEERTPEELWWFRKWQRLRTEILDNGNFQLRSVESEVLLHKVNWQRHQRFYEFGSKSSQSNQGKEEA